MGPSRSKSSPTVHKKNGNGRARPDENFPLVLVVDDDRRDLAKLVALLKRHGFRVQPARTFDEADKLLKSVRYAAVVADYRLGAGSHDGFELLRRAQETQPDAARVIVTSDAIGSVLAESVGGAWISKENSRAKDLPDFIRAWIARLNSPT